LEIQLPSLDFLYQQLRVESLDPSLSVDESVVLRCRSFRNIGNTIGGWRVVGLHTGAMDVNME